jgi:hypothetical protein
MIVPDTNILIYAYDTASPLHEKARGWWIRSLSGSETVGLPWVVILGFIRLWTSPRVFESPMTIELATAHVESWLRRPMVKPLNPGPKHAEIAFGFLRAEGRGGNLTTDAHIAAVALEAGATLYTTDVDFLRFRGLKYVNPFS